MRSILAWRTKWRDGGFTLIEILVALVILSIGMLGLSRASLATLATNAANERRLIAISLGQDRLETIQRAGYAAAIAATYPPEPYGTIANYTGYSRTTTIALDSPELNMKAVTVTVGWDPGRPAVSASTIMGQ